MCNRRQWVWETNLKQHSILTTRKTSSHTSRTSISFCVCYLYTQDFLYLFEESLSSSAPCTCLKHNCAVKTAFKSWLSDLTSISCGSPSWHPVSIGHSPHASQSIAKLGWSNNSIEFRPQASIMCIACKLTSSATCTLVHHTHSRTTGFTAKKFTFVIWDSSSRPTCHSAVYPHPWDSYWTVKSSYSEGSVNFEKVWCLMKYWTVSLVLLSQRLGS